MKVTLSLLMLTKKERAKRERRIRINAVEKNIKFCKKL